MMDCGRVITGSLTWMMVVIEEWLFDFVGGVDAWR
jgi:hypothetical protein